MSLASMPLTVDGSQCHIENVVPESKLESSSACKFLPECLIWMPEKRPMKKLFLLASVVVLAVAWGFAQQENASPAQNAASNQATIRGCLTGADHQYRLVDENHVVYLVKGQDKQLSGFDGQKVEVTGKLEERIPPKEKQTASSFSRPERRLTVGSISTISDTCGGASE